MITYNHEKYISEAIEGVLMQQTTFPIELVIGEDCSTDRTREICLEYQKKYPHIISLLLPKKNMGMMPNFIQTLKACTGKYIALCEGDDYWIDPLKLQKQMDFLEENTNFAICYHRVNCLKSDGSIQIEALNTCSKAKSYSVFDLAKYNLMHTCSVVFKNNLGKQIEFLNAAQLPVGDYVLHMLNAKYGKIMYLPHIMAVYRSEVGVWTRLKEKQRLKKWIIVLDFLLNVFNEDEIVRKLLLEQKLRIKIRLNDLSYISMSLNKIKKFTRLLCPTQ